MDGATLVTASLEAASSTSSPLSVVYSPRLSTYIIGRDAKSTNWLLG